MSEDESGQSTTAWPLPSFNFQVQWDTAVMSFQEVSGLAAESQPVEYQRGDNPEFSVVKMPGNKKFASVTLKNGVCRSDNHFWDWVNQTRMNTIRRLPLTISLLDETGAPTMVWTLANAWPASISGTDLNAHGNEVAIESIEIMHEGITIDNA